MTATPKKIEISEEDEEGLADLKILGDNFKYFGEPVYEYTIGQGQKDGFLAQCEITSLTLNIDKEIYTKAEILRLEPINAKTGKPMEESELKDQYESRHMDKILIIPKRTKEFSKSLMKHFEDSGEYNQKTIIFCASDTHADHVAAELNSMYAKLCPKDQQVKHFAFKFTSKVFLEK